MLLRWWSTMYSREKIKLWVFGMFSVIFCTFFHFSLDFGVEIYITYSMEYTPLKYCLYARKSSESDEKQALSIDSQIHEMQKIAKQEWLDIVETLTESKSAKASGQRKGYIELLNGIREQKYNAILTWGHLIDCRGMQETFDPSSIWWMKVF